MRDDSMVPDHTSFLDDGAPHHVTVIEAKGKRTFSADGRVMNRWRMAYYNRCHRCLWNMYHR